MGRIGGCWLRPAIPSSGFSPVAFELQDKLGLINWQFAPTKQFDLDDFGDFLKLLPTKVEGRAVRYVVEVRHESFCDSTFVKLLRKHHNKVAVILTGDSKYSQIADVTAPFIYAWIMGTTEKQKNGYSKAALDRRVSRASEFATGGVPDDLDTFGDVAAAKASSRDVFLYVISGHKVSNPAAAVAFIERLS